MLPGFYIEKIYSGVIMFIIGIICKAFNHRRFAADTVSLNWHLTERIPQILS